MDADAAATTFLRKGCDSPTNITTAGLRSREKNPTRKDAVGKNKRLTQTTRDINPAMAAEKLMWYLNILPSSIIFAIMLLVFGMGSYFLQKYVITANTALVVFVVGSYVVFSSYFTFDYFLRRYSSSYVQVEEDKKFYILSNLIKSAVLLSYSPLAADLLWKTMYQDVWPSSQIRIMGTLYCIPDFVSLFLVKRMANSTVIHHCVVCIFNVFSLYNNYEETNVIRAIMIYAVFSTFAYMVNLLLASRFVTTTPVVSLVLSSLALTIYVICCGLNWTWQVGFLFKLFDTHPISVTMYTALMSFLVWDDVILMKWLKKNAKRQFQLLNNVPKP